MINNPWTQLMPWMRPWQAPFSHYDQNISPVTTWFSPTYEINYAGNQEIEAKITTEVASFGKQIGILTNAVMEIAEGDHGEAMEKLRAVASQIDEIKKNHQSERPNQLALALQELKETDKPAFDKLIQEVS